MATAIDFEVENKPTVEEVIKSSTFFRALFGKEEVKPKLEIDPDGSPNISTTATEL